MQHYTWRDGGANELDEASYYEGGGGGRASLPVDFTVGDADAASFATHASAGTASATR